MPASPFRAIRAVRAGPTWRIASTVYLTLLCYSTIGLPLAVIPVFTHRVLGFDPVVAGLAVSLQYLATFASRPFAGRMTDTVGPKRAVLLGLSACAGSGLLLLLSGLAAHRPGLSLLLLLSSRVLLGGGESCTGTGCITWAIGRVGVSRTAQVISLNGVASYGGIALGAPLGLAIAGTRGTVPLGLLTLLLALAGLALARAKPAVAAQGGGVRVGFHRILRSVAPYGTALALGSVGFGVLAAFVTLFYDEQGWDAQGWDTQGWDAQGWRRAGATGPGAALSAFGIAFMLTRLLFAAQINRRGGLPVSIASFAAETAGLLLLWQAPTPFVAVLGSALTGAGFALVFPALGVLAVARVAPSSRGSAIGAYSVFLDISLGLSGPLLGLIARTHGYASLFLCAAAASLSGLAICVWLQARPPGGLASPSAVG